MWYFIYVACSVRERVVVVCSVCKRLMVCSVCETPVVVGCVMQAENVCSICNRVLVCSV